MVLVLMVVGTGELMVLDVSVLLLAIDDDGEDFELVCELAVELTLKIELVFDEALEVTGVELEDLEVMMELVSEFTTLVAVELD